MMELNLDGRSPTMIVWPVAKVWAPPHAVVVHKVKVTVRSLPLPVRCALMIGRRLALPFGKLRIIGTELFAELPAVSKVMSAPLSVS